MELLHEYGRGPRRGRFSSSSTSDLTRGPPVSKLIILQARFQQKQLQEKEEKLLRLYEEQRERAMNRVGARDSLTSKPSVGRGRLESRRGTSVESKQGRDRSFPLEPIAKGRSLERSAGSWSRARGVYNSDLRLFDEDYDDEDEEEEEVHRGVRRTQSQVRSEKPKSKLLYFGGSHTDLRFSDELDYVQTFHVIDDHYEIADRGTDPFGGGRRFREESRDGLSRSNSMSQRRGTEYKTFASQRASTEKPHLGNGVARKPSARELPPQPRQSNGTATRVRKPTPMPSSTSTPKQSTAPQGKRATAPVRKTEIRVTPRAPEGHDLQHRQAAAAATPPVPASRTTLSRSHSEKPSFGKAPPRANAFRANDLPECQHCGRHFAEDRIAKHEDICKKSSRTKRKPFDSVKQRIKGTEAEQFLKGATKLRTQPQQQQQKQVKVPQRDWRKTHEDFISSIRAAREYQIASSQMKKPSATRSSTGSRY